jgi:hypothetical protein
VEAVHEVERDRKRDKQHDDPEADLDRIHALRRSAWKRQLDAPERAVIGWAGKARRRRGLNAR